jgi:ABC-type transporter Mla subunit MlaD
MTPPQFYRRRPNVNRAHLPRRRPVEGVNAEDLENQKQKKVEDLIYQVDQLTSTVAKQSETIKELTLQLNYVLAFLDICASEGSSLQHGTDRQVEVNEVDSGASQVTLQITSQPQPKKKLC